VGILIDASVLIEHERGRLDLSARLSGREEEPFHLSVITVSELLHGVHRAADAKRRATRSAFVEAVIERFPLLGIDVGTARAHARIWSELAAAGTTVGAHDLWLAAAAISHDLAIATANVREFRRVPGLRVEDWSGDTA
jgi:tRNA(fMet)-specific endonuclease VapC